MSTDRNRTTGTATRYWLIGETIERRKKKRDPEELVTLQQAWNPMALHFLPLDIKNWTRAYN